MRNGVNIMKTKKAQITVFLIIGVIILISVGLIIYMKDKVETSMTEDDLEFSTAAQPVAPFVEQCIKKTLQEAIIVVAERGGAYELPPLSTKEAYKNAPYYIYGTDMYLPTSIENNIKLYFEENIRFCTQGFTELPGLEIAYDEPKAEILLGENTATATVDYPLRIMEATGEITKMSRFKSSTPTRILEMSKVAEEIVKTPIMFESHCLTCINEIMKTNDFKLSMVDDYEGTFFAIVDNSTIINEEPVRFRFVTILAPEELTTITTETTQEI